MDRPFRCEQYGQPLDLGFLKVTLSPSFAGSVDDAVNLNRGECAGRIGRVEVDTWIGDGIKIGQKAHDLVVESGYVYCHDRLPLKHQDGVQALGGVRVTFRNLHVYCPSSNDASFFVTAGAGGSEVPTEGTGRPTSSARTAHSTAAPIPSFWPSRSVPASEALSFTPASTRRSASGKRSIPCARTSSSFRAARAALSSSNDLATARPPTTTPPSRPLRRQSRPLASECLAEAEAPFAELASLDADEACFCEYELECGSVPHRTVPMAEGYLRHRKQRGRTARAKLLDK